MFKSLQSRIIALFVLAIVTSATALVFVLVRFNDIGDGLDTLNARYLPIADEATRLEIIVNQLQREQDSLSRSSQSNVNRIFLNAPFYTEELKEGLERTRTLLTLPLSNTEQLDQVVFPMLDELSLLLGNYVTQLKQWRQNPSVEERKGLDRHKTKLVLGVNRFSATINAQCECFSRKTALAREQSSQLGTILAMCSFGFWVMLVVLMLRTLRPIQELTTQVQKIRSGKRVTPLSESIAEESLWCSYGDSTAWQMP